MGSCWKQCRLLTNKLGKFTSLVFNNITMNKKQLVTGLFLTLLTTVGSAQDKKESFFKNSYFSVGLNYRSYGTNDHIGFGGGIESSKDIKKWLGIGLNISYWSNDDLDWDFVNPFTGQRFQYYGKISEFKIAPFIQLIPLNTTYFDVIIRLGLRTGYYNQKYYLGGYNTDWSSSQFDIFIYDGGYKGINFGYETGAELRFQIDKFFISPSIILISNDTNANSFSALNLKLGFQI